jgi:hypothetical protein
LLYRLDRQVEHLTFFLAILKKQNLAKGCLCKLEKLALSLPRR